MILFILFAEAIFFFSSMAHAETVQCTKSPEMEEYELLTSDVKFKIEHPFRVFEGSAKSLTGTLLANPKSAKEGLNVSVTFSPDAIETTSDVLKQTAKEAAASNSKLEFRSTVAEYPRGMQFGTQPFKFKMRGELTYRGITQVIDVPTQCALKGEFWECIVDIAFAPSIFGLTTPGFLRVPARDLIVARGEVNFGPKREK